MKLYQPKDEIENIQNTNRKVFQPFIISQSKLSLESGISQVSFSSDPQIYSCKQLDQYYKVQINSLSSEIETPQSSNQSQSHDPKNVEEPKICKFRVVSKGRYINNNGIKNCGINIVKIQQQQHEKDIRIQADQYYKPIDIVCSINEFQINNRLHHQNQKYIFKQNNGQQNSSVFYKDIKNKKQNLNRLQNQDQFNKLTINQTNQNSVEKQQTNTINQIQSSLNNSDSQCIDLSQNNYVQYNSQQFDEVTDQQLKEENDKKIRRHERNLYPYFGVHFIKSLRYNQEFQMLLIQKIQISNPIGYLIDKIGSVQLNTKQNLDQLLSQKDQAVNQAIKLWFQIFLKKSLNSTKSSKNKHISNTHIQRKQAFLRRGQQVVKDIIQIEKQQN